MGRLNKLRFTRKAGYQIPAHITDLMESLHPTVDILWDNGANQWALVQSIGGVLNCIRVLGKGVVPTLENTVYFLTANHPSRLASEFARERFLRELDENQSHSDVARRSADQIREGSKALFNRLTNRLVVPIRR